MVDCTTSCRCLEESLFALCVATSLERKDTVRSRTDEVQMTEVGQTMLPKETLVLICLYHRYLYIYFYILSLINWSQGMPLMGGIYFCIPLALLLCPSCVVSVVKFEFFSSFFCFCLISADKK